MKHLSIFVFLFQFISLFSQQKCIKLTLKDSVSTDVLSNVQITLFNAEDKILNSFFTDSNGFNKICDVSNISKIEFNLTGYKTLVFKSYFNTDTFFTIFLKNESFQLKSFGIKATKDKEPITIEKKVYNVANNSIAAGGTAIDALRQVPAIDVDANGQISLRGSDQVLIYINGKQSSLRGAELQNFLNSIPASNIESIEVNTAPGAKQDAEGVSGIVNIQLKQNIGGKNNGNIMLGIGTNQKYNASLSYNSNYKSIKMNNTLSYRYNTLWGKGYNNRENFVNSFNKRIDQNSNNLKNNISGAWSGYLDWNPDKTTFFSLSYLLSTNKDKDSNQTYNYLSDFGDTLYNTIERLTLTNKNNKTIDIGFQARKNFSSNQHYITSLVNFSGQNNKENSPLYQYNLNLKNLEREKNQLPLDFGINSLSKFQTILFQTDYVKPFKNGLKLETGFKYTHRYIDQLFLLDSLNRFSNQRLTDSSVSNQFIYQENVSAIYGMVTYQINDIIKYNLGLRVENTEIDGNQKFTFQTFKNAYTNLFPSATLQFMLKKKYNLPDLQLNYSRRINRPQQNQLNPFLTFSDAYNFFNGNPNLKPELIDIVELSGIYNHKKSTYAATLYYRKTNDFISRFRFIDSNSISLVSFYNLEYSTSIGAEAVARFELFKKVKMTLNGNLFQYFVKGDVLGNQFTNQILTYSGKANLNYMLPYKIDFQSSFNIMGPRVGLQGKILSMYGLEIGFRKNILKDKFSFQISLADVFDNRRFKIEMDRDPKFRGEVYRKTETRILTFNFTWNFGQINTQPEKKPKQVNERMDMDF